MNQAEFRKKLGEINNQPSFSQHPKFIDNLRFVYSHNIHINSNPFIFNSTTDCFDFVFGNKIPKDIQNKIKRIGQSNPDSLKKTITNLISKGLIDLHEQQRDEDRVAVYFKDGIPEHFGQIVDNVIMSKWGRGHVWKHGLWEVPHSYGDHVKYSTGEINIDLLRDAFN